MFEFVNSDTAYLIVGGAMAATAGVVTAISQGLATNWNNFSESFQWAFMVLGAACVAFLFGPATVIIMLVCVPFLLSVTLLWSLSKVIKWAVNAVRPQQQL